MPVSKCEFCNKDGHSITFWVDRKMEVGTRRESQYDETVCLCEQHREEALNVLFKGPSFPEQRDFFRQLQLAKNKRIETKIQVPVAQGFLTALTEAVKVVKNHYGSK